MVIYYVDLDGRDYLAFVARGTTVSVCKMEKAMNRIYLRVQFNKFKENVNPGSPKNRGKVSALRLLIHQAAYLIFLMHIFLPCLSIVR